MAGLDCLEFHGHSLLELRRRREVRRIQRRWRAWQAPSLVARRSRSGWERRETWASTPASAPRSCSIAGFDLLELGDHLELELGRQRLLEQRLVDEFLDIVV